MLSNNAREEFESNVRQLVGHIVDQVSGDVPDWKQATAEIRAPTDGSSSISKLRIVRGDGTLIKDSGVPMDANMLFLNKVWKLRSKAFSKPWYGISFSLHPDGTYETEYIYDPDCINDETFYDFD